MRNNTFYNEILTDHNLHPAHKHDLPDANFELEGVNPSCGDDIVLKLRVEGDKIVDGAYVGDGCAISQASADMMLDLIIGRSKEEATHLAEVFLRMIKGKITEEEKDELEEAGVLEDISHMPARVKCAVLGWRTMNEIFDDPEKAQKKVDKPVSSEGEICHL
ncbi:MAG: SUF system NifU family Fe-S cluster assembly protein [Eubacterium sp.]|nr:SUF system NifU family Fe-S cluster assembly protein [Eubacterium sp.]